MKYNDRVYGRTEIAEPVILELINCSALQRLKGVNSAGYSKPYFPGAHYRFEHSVGVYLLLKIYGASIEEQISGLIHDVSHSVFSHCIDYAINLGSEEKQNYQDKIFPEFINQSQIPSILGKYGFKIESILNDSNFPLKERWLPALCADRIDYSLRDALVFREIKSAEYFLEDLSAHNGQWIFNSYEVAHEYTKLFSRINEKYYSGLLSAVMLKTTGDYLRYSLSKKYISRDDLYTTDDFVISKTKKYFKTDPNLKLLFDRMNNKISGKNVPENYDVEVSCKSRAVDPLCEIDGEIKNVSMIDHEWRDALEKELRPKTYFIKFDR